MAAVVATRASTRPSASLVLFGASIVTVAPLFLVRRLPILDLPEHVATIALIRHLGDATWRVPEHYALNWGHSQYLLYHFVGAMLTVLVGSADYANRILLAAVGLAYPYALRALLRATGRDERLALFGCALFWNRALIVGFLPFVASLPLLVFSLSLVVGQARAATRRRAGFLAVAAVALFYFHVSAYLLFVTIAIMWTALLTQARVRAAGELPSATKAVAARLAWLMPSAGCAALWALMGRLALFGGSLADEHEIGQMPLPRALHALPLWISDLWPSHGDELAAIAWWAGFLLMLFAGRRYTRLGVRRLWLFLFTPLACTVALYLTTPFRVGAAGMLNVRLAPLLPLFAILALGTRRGWAGRVALGLGMAATVATSANAAYVMRKEYRNLGDMDGLLAHTRPGTRLLQLNFWRSSADSYLPPWDHVGQYHSARSGGVSAYSFVELEHWSLRYRPEARPPTRTIGWDFNPCAYRNEREGAYFDYVLVQGGVDPFRDHPPGPVFRTVASSGPFVLYAKVPGERWPAWQADTDEGPCRPRVRRGSSDQSRP